MCSNVILYAQMGKVKNAPNNIQTRSGAHPGSTRITRSKHNAKLLPSLSQAKKNQELKKREAEKRKKKKDKGNASTEGDDSEHQVC